MVWAAFSSQGRKGARALLPPPTRAACCDAAVAPALGWAVGIVGSSLVRLLRKERWADGGWQWHPGVGEVMLIDGVSLRGFRTNLR